MIYQMKSPLSAKALEYIAILKSLEKHMCFYSHGVPYIPQLPKRKMGETLDDICSKAISNNKNLIIPWLLMSSYLYYMQDENILSDGFFDHLFSRMRNEYDSIDHRHKYLIETESIAAASLYYISDGEYPNITKDSALFLMYKYYDFFPNGRSFIVSEPTGSTYFRPMQRVGY